MLKRNKIAQQILTICANGLCLFAGVALAVMIQAVLGSFQN